MTAIRRLRSPREILRALPELLDHEPGESLIILPLANGSGGAVLRFDLPRAPMDPVAAEAFADAVVGYVCRVEWSSEAIVIVTTARSFDGPGRPPWALVELALFDALARAGVGVIASLCRAGDGWGEYGCDDERCSGYGPRPLGEVLPEGASPALGLDSPRGLLELLLEAGSPARRAAIADRLGRIRRDEGLLDRSIRAWDRRLAGRSPARPLAVDTAALALAALEDDELRSAWLSASIFGAGSADELGRTWSELVAGSGRARLPGEPDPAASVSRARLEAAATAARDLVGVAPHSHRAAALTALAVLEWARGRSSMAAECASRALALDDGDGEAVLCGWLADRGVVPPWFGQGLDPSEQLDGLAERDGGTGMAA